MIKINKDGFDAPAILLENGIINRDTHITDYTNSSAGYHLIDKKLRTKFSFCSDTYGHDDVKSLLKDIQNDKCCFCESKVSPTAYGDVEHFRPKAAFRQDETTNYEYPGYYWLCYEWSNLYFSCQVCNGRHKGNYFPLSNPANRADPLIRDISLEDPLFLDPGGVEDPEVHITFYGAFPTSNTIKGKTTIKYLGLDREELNEHRLYSLENLRSLERIMLITKDSINADEAKQIFLDRLEDSIMEVSEYSSMFKNNFSQYLNEI